MRTSVFRPAAVVVAGGALLVAGCTSSGPGASPSSSAPVSAITSSQAASHAPTTITVWSFNTLPHEVAAFKKTLGQLHTTYPWLTVKFVPGKDDAAFAKAVAAGSPPDVFVSSTPDNVGKFCYNRTVAPLDAYLQGRQAWMSPRRSRQRRSSTPSTPASSARCRLLADAYALFYNKKMFADAGITEPPKTMSELTADAKKLTIRNGATIKTFGFVPRSDYNNNSSIYVGSQSGTKYYDSSGKATFALGRQVGEAVGVGQEPERLVRRASCPEVRRHLQRALGRRQERAAQRRGRDGGRRRVARRARSRTRTRTSTTASLPYR